ALLSGALLSVALPASSHAGQDLRYLSFHPVPLDPESSPRGQYADFTTSEYRLRPARPDPALRESGHREAIAALADADGTNALALGEQLLG
ncbi:hypothetical protein WFJ45_22345, partial [Salmonella enterica subsp. enterica serovar Minnesota]|uniref:hypothetical protein n=1 Tax=Salmonella enterica TaxID=28901 RepID=UPI003D2B3E12